MRTLESEREALRAEYQAYGTPTVRYEAAVAAKRTALASMAGPASAEVRCLIAHIDERRVHANASLGSSKRASRPAMRWAPS